MIKEIKVINNKDFGRRYVSYLLEKFTSLQSYIYIKKDDDRTANGKSMLGILSLAIQSDDEITIIVANDNETVLNSDIMYICQILGCDINEGM